MGAPRAAPPDSIRLKSKSLATHRVRQRSPNTATPQVSSRALGPGPTVQQSRNVERTRRQFNAHSDPAQLAARWILGSPAFAGAGKPEDDRGGQTRQPTAPNASRTIALVLTNSRTKQSNPTAEATNSRLLGNAFRLPTGTGLVSAAFTIRRVMFRQLRHADAK